MTNPILPLLQAALGVALAPVKTALTTAETDPQAALSGLGNLAAAEIGNLPALENEVISDGAKLGLSLLAEIEAKLSGSSTTVASGTTTSAASGTNGAGA